MNINDLTIGEAKQLASLFAGAADTKKTDPMENKFVICRCYSAGVHAGYLVRQDGDVVMLANARRLWSWKAKEGVALSGVAANGLADGCKVDSKVSAIRLTGVIETILGSEKSEESINGKE